MARLPSVNFEAFNLQDFGNEIRQNLLGLEIGEEIRQIGDETSRGGWLGWG